MKHVQGAHRDRVQKRTKNPCLLPRNCHLRRVAWKGGFSATNSRLCAHDLAERLLLFVFRSEALFAVGKSGRRKSAAVNSSRSVPAPKIATRGTFPRSVSHPLACRVRYSPHRG